MERAFKAFYDAAIVVHRLTAAVVSLSDNPGPLRSRVTHVLPGPLTQDYAPQQAKDFFYELETAAALKNAGFSVALREPDVVISGNALDTAPKPTHNGVMTHVGISLVFGLIVMAMILAFGSISGAHLNPAVTLAFAAVGRFKGVDVPTYVAAQCVGALAASAALNAMFPGHATLGATLPSGTATLVFAFESLLTFVLMLVILAVSSGASECGVRAAIAVGGVVGLEAIVGGPVSGASMNPARSLAPALVSGNLASIWVYLVAPTLGALAAVPCWALVMRKQSRVVLTSSK